MTSEMNRTLGVEEKSVNNCECSRKRQVNGSRTARIWQVVAPLLFVAFGLFGVNENAWGAWYPEHFYAKLTVNTSPSGCGKVIVDTEYKEPTAESDWEDIKSGLSYNNANLKFYISIQANTGYQLSSWSNGTPTYEKTQNGYGCYHYTMNTSSTNKNNPATKTITANFTPIDYTITLNKHNGESNATVGVTYDSNRNLTSNVVIPTKTGYTFGGYYTEENGNGTQRINASGAWVAASGFIVDGKWKNAGNVTLHAKWTPANYTITLAAGEGTTSAGTTSITATYDANTNLTSAIVKPIKTGYTFAGYFTGENGSGTQLIDADGNVLASKSDASYTYTDANRKWKYANNITLKAYWLAKYSVKFNANGGSGSMDDQSFVQGTAQNLRTNTFTRTGYTFAGWATSENGSAAYIDGYNYSYANPNANQKINLYAKWTANTYSVVFHGNGNTTGSMSNQSFNYDETKALTTNAFAKSYTVTFDANGGTCGTASLDGVSAFQGWATSEDGDKVYNDKQSVSNLTATNNGTFDLYAKWGVGSIVLPSATGETIQDHLEGWYNGKTKVGDAGSAYTPTDNIELTAHWTREQLTPSFDGADTPLKVGEEQTPAFTFNNTDGPVAHIEVTSISGVNDGSGKVIEYDASSNTIIARNAGIATIYFTQAATDAVKADTSATWTYTVTKKEPSFTGSNYNSLKVDDVQTADYTYTNTSALIPSASKDSNFYYTIDSISYTKQSKNKKYNSLDSLVRFVPGTKAIVALNAGRGKITFRQKETYMYKADSASFEVRISKYDPSISGSNYTGLKVEDVQSNAYSFSNTSAAKPSASAEDDFYYTIDDVEFANEGKNNGTALVTYDPTSNTLIANNAGTGKITFRQEENYKYEGRIQSFNVAIGKYPNTIYVKGQTNYSASIVGLTGVVEDVTLTATNTDYAGSPFEVTQTSGSSVAAFDQGAQTITALGTASTASWSVTQPENYKYLEGTGSFSATVSKADETTCYVFEKLANSNTVASNVGDCSWTEVGVAKQLIFAMKKNGAGGTLKYRVKVGNDWSGWTDQSTSNKDNFNDVKTINLNENATAVEFGKSGIIGTDNPYVTNIRVTRKTWLTTSNITITKQADGNTPVYPSTEGKGSLSVSYSISNGGSLMLSCDNSKFKFTNSKNSATGTPISLSTGDCESDALNIPVYFSATKEGTETANVVIYNNVFRATATITATTIKRTPSVTAPTAINPVYTGSAQNLVNAATTNGGELQYRLGDGEWSTAVPTATNAGDYTVYYKVVGNDNYYDVAAKSVSASIKKANAVLNSAPTAVANLVYTGSAQSLVNAGTATNGTLQYAVGNGEYSTSIPQATNADTYTVYYKVVGNANYNDVAASSVEVTITRAASSLTKAPTAVANLVYTGTEQTLVNNDGTANGGTIQYSLNNENYSADLPTATNAGAHTVYYKVVGDENHNNTDAANFSVTIGTKALTITADNKGVTYGDDAPANSVQYAGFVNSETSAVLGGTLDYDCSYAAGSAVGTYDIMPKGLTSGNYAITFSKGTLTVGKKTLTVTADDKNISYGAAAPTYTASYSGFAGEETASVLGGTLAFACTYKAGDDATDYTITPSGLTSGNYAFNYVAGTLHVGKAAATVTAPTAKELTYNGSAQALINAGSTEHGDILYKLGSGDWSADVPTATNAGNYTVSYKVVADANHNDVAETAVANVAIAKATPEVTAPTAINPEYTGLAQNLVNAGSTTGGTLQYSLLPSAAYSPSIPQAAFIGTYIVYYRVVGNDNYNNVDPAYISATIARPAISIVNSSSWDDVSDSTSVRIPGSTNIVIDEAVSLYSLTIEAGSKLTIAPTGSLRLGKGGITGAAKDSLVLQAVTDATKASSETLGQTSALIFSPEYTGDMPVAKVEMYSVGYKDLSGATDRDEWQYVGIPIAKADYAAKDAFPKSWVYSWNEATDSWVNNRSTLKLQPFVGVATTQYRDANGYKMTFEGQLADNRGIKEVPLTHAGEGWNLIANSFAGPIDVTKLTVEDFGGAEATIHIWDTKEDQYIELPVGSIKGLDDRQHVIPSMQAFFVQTSAATTLTLDYNRLVWGGEESNVPLKAKRNGQSESSLNGRMSISLTDGVSTDNLYLLESQNYATAYENGYDAPKKFSEANVNAIYAIEDERALSVDATNSIAGTRLGLRTTGSGSYLMMFTRVEGSDDWYLLDKQTGAQMLIQEGADYEFEVESGAPVDDRFEIVGPAAAPGVATDVENSDVAEKAVKYLDNNILIIQRKGTKYNSLGQKIQ